MKYLARFNFKDHPGTPVLFWVTIAGGIAGYQRCQCWEGVLGGAGLLFLIFGIMYLIGAYKNE